MKRWCLDRVTARLFARVAATQDRAAATSGGNGDRMREVRSKGALVLAILGMILSSPAVAQIAFVRVNVVPMDEERIIRNQTVLIEDGKVVAIGRHLALPQGTRVIDGKSRWLVPGLADMHVHSDTREDLLLYLANGVTTIVNMGDARPGFVARTAPAATTGVLPGPRIYNAFVVDGSPEYGHVIATSPAEARAAAALALSNGYRFLKVYNNLAATTFAALADEGRRLGLPLVGHGVTAVGLREQVAKGQVLVAHAEEFFYSFFTCPGKSGGDDPPLRDAVADAVSFALQYKLAIGADLVTYGTIMEQMGRSDAVERFLAAPAAAYVSPADRLAWRRSAYVGKTAKLTGRYHFLETMLKAMAQADVELLTGTDAPTIPGVAPGFSLHDNLGRLERAGLTRFQVLATATRNPGRFLAKHLNEAPSGIVTPGARADLLLVERNPLDDLSVLQDPVGVLRGDTWYEANELQALIAGVAGDYRRAAPPRAQQSNAQ